MKIYISGPITGTDDYMNRFCAAEEKAKKIGYEVVNPAKVNAMLPESTEYEDYMTMSMVMLDMCDAICMMHGWEESKGAMREYNHAKNKEIAILSEEDIELLIDEKEKRTAWDIYRQNTGIRRNKMNKETQEYREVANTFRKAADIVDKIADNLEDTQISEKEKEDKQDKLFAELIVQMAKLQ